jgi:hypothetical protein
MTLIAGTTLGRYQILEPLGQGGMAVVYKAYQPALDRTVALKIIRRGFAEDPEFRDRFSREAKAIARLIHPNIVQVHDFDESDGQVYLAMQYLEGGTLKDHLARLAAEGRRMEQDEVARIVEHVAAALRYAHDEGVIHRDVKPSNIMLTKRGGVVVTDFGIAKIVGGTQHTATGVGIGTPEYMSPEQGQGQALDGRTDQYALAVTAYEMLTGTLPYTADTPFAVVLKHVRDPLPLPSRVDPAISARTEQVLLRALAKDPKDRYPSVSEFAEELAHAVAERGGRTLPTVVTPRRAVAASTERVATPAASLLTRPVALAAAGLALLLLGGGGAAVLGAFGAATPTPTATLSIAVTTTAPPTAAPPTTPGAGPSGVVVVVPTDASMQQVQACSSPAPTRAPGTPAATIDPRPVVCPLGIVLSAGDQQRFIAVYQEGGRPVGGPLGLGEVTWSVTPPSLGTISADGLLIATASGSGTVTATSRAGSSLPWSGSAAVTVRGGAVLATTPPPTPTASPSPSPTTSPPTARPATTAPVVIVTTAPPAPTTPPPTAAPTAATVSIVVDGDWLGYAVARRGSSFPWAINTRDVTPNAIFSAPTGLEVSFLPDANQQPIVVTLRPAWATSYSCSVARGSVDDAIPVVTRSVPGTGPFTLDARAGIREFLTCTFSTISAPGGYILRAAFTTAPSAPTATPTATPVPTPTPKAASEGSKTVPVGGPIT